MSDFQALLANPDFIHFVAVSIVGAVAWSLIKAVHQIKRDVHAIREHICAEERTKP